MRMHIIKGGLSQKLLMPTYYLFHIIFVAIGYNSFVLILRMILYIILFYIQGGLPKQEGNMIFILVTIGVSIVILFLVELILGTVAFWINTASNRVIEIAVDLIILTSGSLVLLNFNQITQWFMYSPFAFAAHHPMQIYLGKYSPLQTLYVFLGGIGWCVLLYIAAKWLFNLGLKGNEAVGL
jgi:ABC-type uncharacterized transport system permease subunit